VYQLQNPGFDLQHCRKEEEGGGGEKILVRK
jgi:hypothetical protein